MRLWHERASNAQKFQLFQYMFATPVPFAMDKGAQCALYTVLLRCLWLAGLSAMTVSLESSLVFRGPKPHLPQLQR